MKLEIENQIKADMKAIDWECPLCRLYHKGEIKTEFFHRDRLCVVVLCESSGCPLLVPRFHNREPNRQELNHMVNLIMNLKRRLKWEWTFMDFRNNSVPEHFHIHLR